MTAKRHFSYLYGGHLETCHTYIFYFIIIGFLDPENIRVYTKIVFLTGLQVNTSPKTDCCVAILFLPSKTNSSRMPSWHPPDSDLGSVQDDESIIKVHNDAKTRFSWIWPFGIWTIFRQTDCKLGQFQSSNRFTLASQIVCSYCRISIEGLQKTMCPASGIVLYVTTRKNCRKSICPATEKNRCQ